MVVPHPGGIPAAHSSGGQHKASCLPSSTLPYLGPAWDSRVPDQGVGAGLGVLDQGISSGGASRRPAPPRSCVAPGCLVFPQIWSRRYGQAKPGRKGVAASAAWSGQGGAREEGSAAQARLSRSLAHQVRSIPSPVVQFS